jgi:hypothetical protein
MLGSHIYKNVHIIFAMIVGYFTNQKNPIIVYNRLLISASGQMAWVNQMRPNAQFSSKSVTYLVNKSSQYLREDQQTLLQTWSKEWLLGDRRKKNSEKTSCSMLLLETTTNLGGNSWLSSIGSKLFFLELQYGLFLIDPVLQQEET